MLWLLPIFSAIFLWLSFESPSLASFALIGLIPFFIFVDKTNCAGSRRKKIKKSFLGGWLAGFIFFAFIMRWLPYIWPNDWAGINNAFLSTILVLTSWFGISIFTGLAFGFFGILICYFFNISKNNLFYLAAIPSGWIISEYLRAWLFSLFSWGPKTVLGPYWSFGNLGYTFIDAPLIFLSRFTGLYGLSFFVVLINTLIFLFFFRRNFISSRFLFVSLIVIFTLIFLPVIIYSNAPAAKKSLKVALFQMNTSINFQPLNTKDLGLMWGKAKKLNKFSGQPDIIILPETANFLGFFGDQEKVLMQQFFPDQNKKGLIISSYAAVSNAGNKVQTIYRNQKGELIDVQDKTFLMPGGEFFPTVLKPFIILSGHKKIFREFDKIRSISRGEILEKPVKFADTKVGVLLCSGITTPSFYRSLANQGAEILVNSASHLLFNRNRFVFSQLETMARFYAVANAKPFLQSTNGGSSLFINKDGRVILKTRPEDNVVLFFDVTPSKSKTFYTRLGDWPLMAGFLTLMFSAVVYLKKN